MTGDGRLLRWAVLAAVLTGVIAPVALGLLETGRVAFGLLPAIGAERPSLDAWEKLADLPGLWTSLRLTLVTGFGSTLLSLLVAAGAAAALHARPRLAARLLAPFLAAPHAAIAIGLAFVIAPSGWIARALSPWATGWETPPALATVNDAHGLALILGLMVKEVPFLLLVLLAALNQIPVRAHLAAGRAMGYGRGLVWVKVILPQTYRLIRLPVFAVLAFGLSVVDMAVILGPSNPPTLAVAITRLALSPDTAMLLPAAAAALLLAGIAGGGIALWIIAERLVAAAGRRWLSRGGRGVSAEPGLRAAARVHALLAALGALALAALFLWSFAWRWSYPHALPESWSARTWAAHGPEAASSLLTTLGLAAAATLAAIVLAVAWLEAEDRARRGRARWAEILIYVPLLVPQVTFLFGLNVAFLRAGISGTLPAVIWAHALFVFPYVMIALSDPWRRLDRRYAATAAALGTGPGGRLLRVKLPLLLQPILAAAAIGFAVSVALYLPTLFIGAGRVATLTTEAVALSSGADRRIAGLYALLQAALPWVVYTLAIILPFWLWRDRRGLRGGGTA
jgi:putative thiamine transport system permease protein